jgi:hypothetical protein
LITIHCGFNILEYCFSLLVNVFVEVKSIGVPVKGDHVEGLFQLSLGRAIAVEDEWVACLMQDRVIAKVL